MSRLVVLVERNEDRFPRVSGDEPPAISGYMPPKVFSPRERG